MRKLPECDACGKPIRAGTNYIDRFISKKKTSYHFKCRDIVINKRKVQLSGVLQ